MPDSESVSTMRLLWLIAGGRAVTRMELATLLRQPQSSVSVRVQALLAAGVLTEHGEAVHELAGHAELPGRWLAVGVGLPGPVDVAAGTVTLPSRMPGWRGYPVRDALRRRFEQPVEVDNDANALALGQARGGPPGETLV